MKKLLLALSLTLLIWFALFGGIIYLLHDIKFSENGFLHAWEFISLLVAGRVTMIFVRDIVYKEIGVGDD